MDTIDVHDLPEPQARAVADTVERLRKELVEKKAGKPSPLPEWDPGVVGSLRRDDIYDDRV